MPLNNETLSLFQQAIDVEDKNCYINTVGKHSKFADFIAKTLYSLYKESGKNPRWLGVIDDFEKYDMYDIVGRKRSISALVKFLKNEK